MASDVSGPKCAICHEPGEWCCVFCNSNCYCKAHVCHHIARDYPEEFGLKPKKQWVKKDPDEPDIFIIPKEPDPKTGRIVPPLWMLYTKEPEPKKARWEWFWPVVIIGIWLLIMFASR
jgi:hypothetical protein